MLLDGNLFLYLNCRKSNFKGLLPSLNLDIDVLNYSFLIINWRESKSHFTAPWFKSLFPKLSPYSQKFLASDDSRLDRRLNKNRVSWSSRVDKDLART